jgi:hypothetical protein
MAQEVMAQEDRLIKKNGDQLNIKVIEVNDETVKYKDFSNQSGPDFVIRRRDFVKIKLADGTEIDGIIDRTSPPDDRKGFVGLSVGVNTLMEDYSDFTSSGVEGTLTFGYVFSRVVGISASGFLNRHNAGNYEDNKWNIYGAYAGPLFSIPAGAKKRLRIHLVPYVGFAKVKLTESQSGVSGSITSDMELTAGINSMVAWRFADVWALTGGLEARYLKVEEIDFSSIKLSVGLALCF